MGTFDRKPGPAFWPGQSLILLRRRVSAFERPTNIAFFSLAALVLDVLIRRATVFPIDFISDPGQDAD
jgi:hypothetical protein